MRISNLQIFHRGLSGIMDNQVSVNKTQQQLSSGKRILNPADSPVDATRILQLTQDSALRTQYDKNITAAENRLRLEESVLTSINDNIQRVRELTIQSGNGALTQNDRVSISAEVEQRLEGIVSLMNTKDAGNEYIFSGFKGKDKPFEASPGGGYKYQGDEGSRRLPVAENTMVTTGDNGKKLFESIKGAQISVKTQASSSNQAIPPAVISQGTVVDQEILNEFYPESVVISFNAETDISPPGANFTVRRESDNRIVSGLSNITLAAGTSIDFHGMSLAISGSPSPGDSFIVESSKNQSLTSSIENLTKGLRSLSDNSIDAERLQNLLADSVINLDNARDKILEVRSQIGGRLNTVESVNKLHDTVNFNNTETLSRLRDVDFAEATSRLAMESFVLEAAQQSYVKISRLSLMSFLR